MPNQESYDANFFALAHHVLHSSQDEAPERRGDDRRQYPWPQLIAPCRDGRLPAASDFRRVPCHDLSNNGFSYLSATAPDCEYLVVALGKRPYLFVTAQVIRHAAQQIGERTVFLVGCRFVSRIKDHDFGPLPESL